MDSRSGSGVGVCVEMGAATDTVGASAIIVDCTVSTAEISESLEGVDSSHAVIESKVRVTNTISESVVKRAHVIKPFIYRMSVIGENRPARWYGIA